jgi:hypothetical protein
MKAIKAEGLLERPSVFSMCTMVGKSKRQPARILLQATILVLETGVFMLEFIVWVSKAQGVR